MSRSFLGRLQVVYQANVCGCRSSCQVMLGKSAKFRRKSTFRNLNLSRSIVRKLDTYNINTPTPIQVKAIPLIKDRANVVINAETGSGKTLAYVLPILEQLSASMATLDTVPGPHTIVLVPGIELAHQVSNVFKAFLSVLSLDARIVHSEMPLRITPNTAVLVGTPSAFSYYKFETFNSVKTVVVDEADVLLMKSRKDPVFKVMNFFTGRTLHLKKSLRPKRTIMNEVPDLSSINLRQFVFAGATIPIRGKKTAMPIIERYTNNVEVVQTDSTHRALENIRMDYLEVAEGNKFKLLAQCILQLQEDPIFFDGLRVMIFVNTTEKADTVFKSITKVDRDLEHVYSMYPDSNSDDVPHDMFRLHQDWHDKVSLMHGGVDYQTRMEAVHDLSSSDYHILVSTGVAARGLDIPDVDVVIQFDFSTNVVDILHRCGRTGRMGKRGRVINFITAKDRTLSNVLRGYIERGESIEPLFSRRRGLRQKLKSGRVSVPDACDERDVSFNT